MGVLVEDDLAGCGSQKVLVFGGNTQPVEHERRVMGQRDADFPGRGDVLVYVNDGANVNPLIVETIPVNMSMRQHPTGNYKESCWRHVR